MRASTSIAAAGVVALGLLSGPSLAFRQDVTFRYQWKKGVPVKYRVVQQSTTTLSGLPGGMDNLTIEQSTSQTLTSVAEDVAADGTTTLRQTVDAMKMELNSPVLTMAYDSANPDANPSPTNTMLKNIFSQLIGQSYTVTMAPTGE